MEITEMIRAKSEGLELPDEVVIKIAGYTELVIDKNKSLNLMSRQLDVETIIGEHIYDCLAPWKLFKEPDSIADLGTGAGLPGILLSILFPEKKIILIEKSVKKSIFLNDAVKRLGLKNAAVVNKTVPEAALKTEAVTCRAFKSVAEILAMTEKYYNSGGKYILYKGRIEKINAEIAEAMEKYKFKYQIIKTAPDIGKERHIVLLNK